MTEATATHQRYPPFVLVHQAVISRMSGTAYATAPAIMKPATMTTATAAQSDGAEVKTVKNHDQDATPETRDLDISISE